VDTVTSSEAHSIDARSIRSTTEPKNAGSVRGASRALDPPARPGAETRDADPVRRAARVTPYTGTVRRPAKGIEPGENKIEKEKDRSGGQEELWPAGGHGAVIDVTPKVGRQAAGEQGAVADVDAARGGFGFCHQVQIACLRRRS